ncbi:MAG: cytochrome-c peroxidase [Phaeodactylibacter sp.]|nr:cytochrome-c peroxidase [Phaeodactylibacter sp.]
MKNFKFLVLFAVLAFLSSCQNESNDESYLDATLTEVINAASSGQGLNAFILPASDDYQAIPQDPKNPLSREKVELGRLLYHEPLLAIHPKYEEGLHTYSCASCHHAAAGFQAGVAQGIADGGVGFGLQGEARARNPLYRVDSLDIQPIRSPTILNSAYSEVTLWNGQFGATGKNVGTEHSWNEGTPKFTNYLGFQGVETQAIAGLTVHRMGLDMAYFFDSDYKGLYDIVFGDQDPSERYSIENTGLAIAAYERSVLANQAPFQAWLRGDLDAMTDEQKRGAILFFGKANCSGCHSGPALGGDSFHALGMKDLDSNPSMFGTVDEATKKGRGGFTGNSSDYYKFKTPTLYSMIYSPHYGHGSSFNSIYDVIQYKNKAVPENNNVPYSSLSSQFVPLGLTDEEVQELTAFLEQALNDSKLERFLPAGNLPSNYCFPNNDALSRLDLGCF